MASYSQKRSVNEFLRGFSEDSLGVCSRLTYDQRPHLRLGSGDRISQLQIPDSTDATSFFFDLMISLPFQWSQQSI